MATQQRALICLADNAEDVASGLHIFRDGLPNHATRITAVIGELFALSSALRELNRLQADPRHEPSFYRIENDVKLLFSSLQHTLDDATGMFARARDRPQQMVWADLEHRMDIDERVGFLERLGWFRLFLDGLFERLEWGHGEAVGPLRKRIRVLLDVQEVAKLTGRLSSLPLSAAGTSRPIPSRNVSYHRIETPVSPLSGSDWDPYDRPPPPVPDVPLSPTFTTSSSQTLNSSHTSYSNHGFGPGMDIPIPQPVHWAQEIFDGGCSRTPFRGEYVLDEDTVCDGKASLEAVRRLNDDGFLTVVEIPFDRGVVNISLCWRPSDSRARILITTKDHRGRDLFYCLPLNQLRVIRDKSTLRLCQVRSSNRAFKQWARLNFIYYERMVLFYSTLIAMKRQDNREELPIALIEVFNQLNEEVEFGGLIRDGELQHELHLFRDRNSGLLRLVASPSRGPKRNVPIWTAFITKYAGDPDWLALENGGVVSMIALKPPPYVFLEGYYPPKKRNGEYILQFTSSRDATEFLDTWANLCRSRRR